MKRIVAFLLVSLLLTGLSACSKPAEGGPAGDGSVPASTEGGTTSTTEKPEEPDDKIDPDNWGIKDKWRVVNADGQKEYYHINVPFVEGFYKANAKITEQEDGTLTIISGQEALSPKINALSEIFPAYCERVQYTFEHLYGMPTDNYNFTFSEDKAVTIGEYDMHMFKGVVSFEYDGDPRSYQFVAYAAQLKSNGAYAYWLVCDDSEEQNMGEAIAEHAYNMAQTFREEE